MVASAHLFRRAPIVPFGNSQLFELKNEICSKLIPSEIVGFPPFSFILSIVYYFQRKYNNKENRVLFRFPGGLFPARKEKHIRGDVSLDRKRV